MRPLFTAVAFALGVAAASPAFASPVVNLLSFDDVTTKFADAIPTGYGGLAWANFGVIAAAYADPVGLQNAVVSTDYVAIPIDPTGPSFFGGPSFSFKDAYFGAGARDGLVLDIAGFDSSFNVKYETLLTVDTLGAIFHTFNWTDISAVGIFASGGTLDLLVNPTQDSTIYAVDNVRVAFVPEPAALALFGLGIGALALRRRRTA